MNKYLLNPDFMLQVVLFPLLAIVMALIIAEVRSNYLFIKRIKKDNEKL